MRNLCIHISKKIVYIVSRFSIYLLNIKDTVGVYPYKLIHLMIDYLIRLYCIENEYLYWFKNTQH